MQDDLTGLFPRIACILHLESCIPHQLSTDHYFLPQRRRDRRKDLKVTDLS